MGNSCSIRQWRDLPKNHKEIHDFVKSYKPQNDEVGNLRILLFGPTGAGKSSFINSVESVIQDRICGRAGTDATSAGFSYTKKYKTYKINKGNQSHCSFVFTDTRGLESKKGVHLEDIKLALKGHVKEGYQFDPERQLKEGDDSYNSSPSLSDKVHVLVFVVPANSINIMSEDMPKKMRDVRLAASEMEIPQLAILTRVDEACSGLEKNINKMYKCKHLKEKFDELHLQLGVPKNCIFLVKNYTSEIDTNDKMNAHILCAIRRMINFGEDFVNNL
ncbi:interferon-induced protein 44 [Kryptolebias marmoratus]|uniref:interferon-induced protein 44 n=1 Tax=Kryptolebias marmoratus TaxID=37003 RepID=UPI0007F8E633|nr:interferon-induced protein 44 [Kryptolebias marmoratus]